MIKKFLWIFIILNFLFVGNSFSYTAFDDVLVSGVNNPNWVDSRKYASPKLAIEALTGKYTNLRINKSCTLNSALAAGSYGGINIIIAPNITFTITHAATYTSNFIIENGGQLRVGANITISGSITAKGSSITPVVAVNGTETLTFSGSLITNNVEVFGSTLTVSGNQSYHKPAVETLAKLKLRRGLYDKESISLKSRVSVGDGGDGSFIWNASSTAISDDITVVAVTGVATGRWLRQYTGAVNVKWAGALGDGSADDTTEIQLVLTNYREVKIPKGTYKLSNKLTVYPKTKITGDGTGDYITTLTDEIVGTRLVQTAAYPVFSTDLNDATQSYQGYITIRDMTLLGGTVSSHPGTYGIYCKSSSGLKVQNVWIKFFATDGIQAIGSLNVNIDNSIIEYCGDNGIFFEYGLYYTTDANSYMSNIRNCILRQNGNTAIKLGTSTVKVNIVGCDIESTASSHTPAGDGYGIYLSAETRNVTIEGCWLEDNKYHIVVGDDAVSPNLNSIPQNTSIRDCQFWTVRNDDDFKMLFNVGVESILENCEFFGAGKIYLSPYTNNPIIKNCTGPYTVVDGNDNIVTVDSKDRTNVFPYSELDRAGYWTATNCTISTENILSPAGKVPVYKITPSGAGQIQIQSANINYSFLQSRHTTGFYIKSSATEQLYVWPLIYSIGLSKYYTNSTRDIFPVNNNWSWVSIGRNILSTDTSSQVFTLTLTAVDTSPIYITGFTCLPGIVYDSYKVPETGISTLPFAFTPSVYGGDKFVTNGVITMTNFIGGYIGQIITIIAAHAVTLTDGTNILLNGSANFTMDVGDTISLMLHSDNKWYEISRSQN